MPVGSILQEVEQTVYFKLVLSLVVSLIEVYFVNQMSCALMPLCKVADFNRVITSVFFALRAVAQKTRCVVCKKDYCNKSYSRKPLLNYSRLHKHPTLAQQPTGGNFVRQVQKN